MRELPILFNTEMVKAILDDRKTCTRRIVKPQPKSKLCYTFAGGGCGTWGYPSPLAHEIWGEEYKLPEDITKDDLEKQWNPPCHTDDILYVRETWSEGYEKGTYIYKADDKLANLPEFKDSSKLIYHPSIHMPKDAARIWLKVTDVRVERLQEITEDQTEEEGFLFTPPCLHLTGENYCDIDGPCTSKIKYCDMGAGELFGKVLWNRTIKKTDLDRYGWSANPWVWVIEFERCENPGKEQ